MRDYSNLQPLPCGEQDFALLREQNCLYVDKTGFVYKLAHDVSIKVAFLGRPRRFGKSLFLSTLEYYYLGRKDLFEGLKIMEHEKDWKQFEVLHFDLSGCATVEELKSTVRKKIIAYEKKYNILLTGVMKFTQLSLFSALNNVTVLSADNDYAAVCGFTHDELYNDFKPYVERLAEVNNISLDAAYNQIIERYDGYCFSECMTKVINPYSLLNALKDCKLGSYWSYSGATKIIMDSI